jgi:hypothetical protein
MRVPPSKCRIAKLLSEADIPVDIPEMTRLKSALPAKDVLGLP